MAAARPGHARFSHCDWSCRTTAVFTAENSGTAIATQIKLQTAQVFVQVPALSIPDSELEFPQVNVFGSLCYASRGHACAGMRPVEVHRNKGSSDIYY
jgi:hypothetical protein